MHLIVSTSMYLGVLGVHPEPKQEGGCKIDFMLTSRGSLAGVQNGPVCVAHFCMPSAFAELALWDIWTLTSTLRCWDLDSLTARRSASARSRAEQCCLTACHQSAQQHKCFKKKHDKGCSWQRMLCWYVREMFWNFKAYELKMRRTQIAFPVLSFVTVCPRVFFTANCLEVWHI